MEITHHSHREEEEDDHAHYHGVDRAEEHISVDRALDLLLGQITPLKPEFVKLSEALGRVLYEDVVSPINIPELARSTRDGFAVRLGATEEPSLSYSSRFKIIGDVRIGVIPKISLKEGQAVLIATGSHVPTGASAVVMKEYARVEGKALIVERPIKAGDYILKPGEDIRAGETILKNGTVLIPTHISLLTMLGFQRVKVFRRPRVAFFSTGDELVDVTSEKKRKVTNRSKTAKIYDSNRPFIASMLRKLGTEPHDLGIARDNYRVIRSKMLMGLKRFDALILSAGSSVGERDYVGRAASSIKGIKTLAHGIAMRPSSPTGLSVYLGKPFISLPGFPTSAIVSFFVFAMPAVSKLSGRKNVGEGDYPVIRARLLDGYNGKTGVVHFVRVKVFRDMESGEYLANIAKPTEAYFSRWMADANGLAVIEENKGSAKVNEEVSVLVFGAVQLGQLW